MAIASMQESAISRGMKKKKIMNNEKKAKREGEGEVNDNKPERYEDIKL